MVHFSSYDVIIVIVIGQNHHVVFDILAFVRHTKIKFG